MKQGNQSSNAFFFPPIFIKKIFFKLQDNFFTMLCQFLLYNNVNQLCVYIYPLPLEHASHTPIPIPAPQVITVHQAQLPVLYNSFPLAIYFIPGNVYMSILFSQFVPPSPSPTGSTSLFSKSVSLFLPCICTIFLDSTYMQYMIFAFLLLNGKDQRSLQENQRHQGNISCKDGTIQDRNSRDLIETEDIKRGGKNTQKDYTKKVLMNQIIIVV